MPHPYYPDIHMIYFFFGLAFLFLSFLDLKYRTLPGIQVVFWGAVLVMIPLQPVGTAVITLAVAWGWLQTWPALAMFPLMLYPSSWPVLITGVGVRDGVVGRGDLLAAGSIAVVFPWQALIAAFVGLALWMRLWRRRHEVQYIPALPGMFLGLCAWFTYMIVAGSGLM